MVHEEPTQHLSTRGAREEVPWCLRLKDLVNKEVERKGQCLYLMLSRPVYENDIGCPRNPRPETLG